MNPRTEELNKLRLAFERFTRDACDLVARDDTLFAMVPRPWLRIEQTWGRAGGSVSLETEVRHQPLFMSPAERRVLELETAVAALETLSEHPARAALLPPTDSRAQDFDEVTYLRQTYVVGFLKSYFARVTGPAYEPSAFADAFAALTAVITELSVEESVLIPLSGLTWSIESDGIDLGSGVRLRRLDDADREAVLNTGRDPILGGHGPEGQMLLWVQACVDAMWRMPLHSPRLSPERFDAAYDAISALRLAAAGMISAPAYHATSPVVGWYSVGRVFSPLHYRANTTAGPYILSDERLAQVQEMFRALRRMSPADRLNVQLSVDRFHRSFYVQRQEERVVDLMIVLDSLLGTKGPGAVHRLSIRLPLYISNEPNERSRLSELVPKAYDMRSAIVHGRRMTPRPQAEVAAFLAEVEDAIRRVIRRAVLEAAAGIRRIADIPSFIDQELILGTKGAG